MQHWQFWFAVVFIVVATVIGSLIAKKWLGDEPDGAWGAAVGFLVGMLWYARTLYRIGMPYYRRIVVDTDRDRESGSEQKGSVARRLE